MIIAFPHPPGAGGPGSFQSRFEQSLKDLGWKVIYAGSSEKPNLVVVVGGTKRLGWLLRMKQKGVPILYRLDGIGWLHRKIKVGWKHYLTAEYRNWNNKLIHAFLADHIIYQSEFVKAWWERCGLRQRNSCTVIHNGVDLHAFQPASKLNTPIRLVCLEGTIDYSPYALRLLHELRNKLPSQLPMELYGCFENAELRDQLHPEIDYHGLIPRKDVAKVLQGSIFLSLDIHPACPNSVIEALAAGAPVAAFDTGALRELVSPEAGKVVPYGSDPWRLGYPDVDAMTSAIMELYHGYEYSSKEARGLAEERYNFQNVFERYILVMNMCKKNLQ
ncbi:MAG: glycosyltransferase [Proteobacteria bacterium]|nr:glycosyltransferase [Pseudomonadota bacterium]